MVTKVLAASIIGIECGVISVEVDVSTGLPTFEIIGSLSNEVREAKERVRSALKNSGIELHPMKIIANLAPADIKKTGTGYDLAIATGILAGYGYLPTSEIADTMYVGELGLNGELKPINGILSIILGAKEKGINRVVIPNDNVVEASVVSGIEIMSISSIYELIELHTCSDKSKFLSKNCVDIDEYIYSKYNDGALDYKDVSGQESVKRAMEIAAAGFHNILLIGPPGSGKTMLAKRLPTIMPMLTKEECLEITKIYSICGLTNKDNPLIWQRPFCSPHHTISTNALAGGGSNPKPGIITRSHKGILFLDEAVHFTSAALEILRQPIEDKKIHIARTRWKQTFPADFMLVAAINPCPCGNYPDLGRCTCTPEKIRSYIGKISGPILDRIDICVEAPKVEFGDGIGNGSVNRSSKDMRENVLGAIKMQRKRYKGTDILFNSMLTSKDIDDFIELTDKNRKLMEDIYKRMNLSFRGYHRILKVARTIADISGCSEVLEEHLLEAVGYRNVEDRYFR